MSMMNCIECGLSVDTDDNPEAFVTDCTSAQPKDYVLCEDCRSDFDELELEGQLDKALKWGDMYERWLRKPIREVSHERI